MLLYLNGVAREIAPQDSVGLLRSPAADCLPRRAPHQRFVACWVLRPQTGGVPFFRPLCHSRVSQGANQ